MSGRYFDNDGGRFSKPRSDTGDPDKVTRVAAAINGQIEDRLE